MSCGGNRFACGIRRFEKHKFEPNRPSNQELHNENESRLSELLRSREQQDQTFFPSQTAAAPAADTVTKATNAITATPAPSTYAPWVYRENPSDGGVSNKNALFPPKQGM